MLARLCFNSGFFKREKIPFISVIKPDSVKNITGLFIHPILVLYTWEVFWEFILLHLTNILNKTGYKVIKAMDSCRDGLTYIIFWLTIRSGSSFWTINLTVIYGHIYDTHKSCVSYVTVGRRNRQSIRRLLTNIWPSLTFDIPNFFNRVFHKGLWKLKSYESVATGWWAWKYLCES